MDFYISDNDENVVKQSDVIYNIFVDFDTLHKYLQSSQYNDPTIRRIIRPDLSKIKEVSNDKNLIENFIKRR